MPIFGVRSDYYDFAVTVGEADGEIFAQNEAKIISRGWVFHSSGTLKIAGIGYFKDMSCISEQNSLSFRVKRGRYRLEILGGYRGTNFSGSPASCDDTPILSDTPVFCGLRPLPSLNLAAIWKRHFIFNRIDKISRKISLFMRSG